MSARRLVLVVRADPVICGHAGEARNLAEAALHRGFDDVRIVTWPLEVLDRSGLPLKPADSILPYSRGITVERPGPVGDYKVPDARYLAGLIGRLVELFTDGVPTVAMSLYLSPHATAVVDAVRIARSTGLPVRVTTVAEAVGSDVTNVVREAVELDRFGSAAQVLSDYLAHDVCLAVSRYTRDIIVAEAAALDARHGTQFAARLADRVEVSYPAIDTSPFLVDDVNRTRQVLAARGLIRDGYILFLSRLAHAKGVDDLIEAYRLSGIEDQVELVIAGNGPQSAELHDLAQSTGLAHRIRFLHDVGDDEKVHLMAGSAVYALPSKPRPEFTETFGIALVEKMLAGGGVVVTTDTGGINEAVGDHAVIVPAADPEALASALVACIELPATDRIDRADAARAHALQFDRVAVLDALLAHLTVGATNAPTR